MLLHVESVGARNFRSNELFLFLTLVILALLRIPGHVALSWLGADWVQDDTAFNRRHDVRFLGGGVFYLLYFFFGTFLSLVPEQSMLWSYRAL